ncbi:MAG: hypothetical protein PHR69_04295, partial [Sphaerochaeta sp.]|nr:hypothetical protein [Sphaerochaeta sp.]
VAPDASIISTRIDWSVYFYEFIKGYVNGEKLDQDWCKGLEDDAIVMTPLNTAIAAPGTQEKLNQVMADIAEGKIKVFDTSTFTVKGEELTHSFARDTDGDFVADTDEAVFDGEFHESYFQSAPYFTEQIDGITWLNAAY